jgi:hypothetical protein
LLISLKRVATLYGRDGWCSGDLTYCPEQARRKSGGCIQKRRKQKTTRGRRCGCVTWLRCYGAKAPNAVTCSLTADMFAAATASGNLEAKDAFRLLWRRRHAASPDANPHRRDRASRQIPSVRNLVAAQISTRSGALPAAIRSRSSRNALEYIPLPLRQSQRRSSACFIERAAFPIPKRPSLVRAGVAVTLLFCAADRA